MRKKKEDDGKEDRLPEEVTANKSSKSEKQAGCFCGSEGVVGGIRPGSTGVQQHEVKAS